jgi:hypothetical protein
MGVVAECRCEDVTDGRLDRHVVLAGGDALAQQTMGEAHPRRDPQWP